MRVRYCFIFLLIGLTLLSCDLPSKKEWSIVVSKNNSKYEKCASIMQKLFEEKGLQLNIIKVSSSVEAAKKVARGEADFTLALSHADYVIPKLGAGVKELRTVMPMFENAMFIFYRATETPRSIIDLGEHSKIYLEVLDSLSEQYIGLKRVFGMLNIHEYEFVTDTAQATLVPIWGTFSGSLVKEMLTKKWKLYSMEESFIEYALIIEPRFGRLQVPVRYAGERTRGINTLLSTAYLISGAHVDKTALYDIISMLYDNRVHFTSQDKSYMVISEDFNTHNLNFPLHTAMANFLVRNDPTLLERHAEYYALLISILILVFGFVQSIRNYIARRKKDRIDLYFQEYLEIKSDPALDALARNQRLELLLAKAIQQMVNEKLDISDFNVFSQTIELERINSRQQASERLRQELIYRDTKTQESGA